MIALNPYAAAAIAAVIGLFIGSFLNVVVWRLPRGESLVSPPSRCPICEHPLAWYDNVPVFGWLALRTERESARRARLNLCLRCGYDLQATPQEGGALLSRCPECGAVPEVPPAGKGAA